MHDQSGDLGYALLAIGLAVALVVAWIVAKVDAAIPECPARELPELGPDDDSTAEWHGPAPAIPSGRYAEQLARWDVRPDRERYPAPKVPRPGQD